jgi:hypothetical protein
MDLIILNDGLYQLVPLTKQMMEHMSLLVKSRLFRPMRYRKVKINNES